MSNVAIIMMRRLIRGTLACLCAGAVACGGASDPTATIDNLPRLSAVEEQRIGSADDPDIGFSYLPRVDVDSDGNVFALEFFGYTIRVYTPDGRLLRRIGRRGGGPGEFVSAPARFGVVGDTLWVYEWNGRITLFDRDGNVLHTGRTRGQGARVSWGGSTSGYVTPYHMRADGYFIGWFGISARSDPQLTQYLPIPRVLFDPSGNVADTVGWLPAPPPTVAPPPGRGSKDRLHRIVIGSQLYSVPAPPLELPVWLPLPDGHVIVDAPYPTNGDTGHFTVTKVGLAGDTLFQRVFSYAPERYTEALLDSAAFQQVRTFNTGVDITPKVDWHVSRVLRANMQFPPFHLPIDVAWVANDGVVWLRRLAVPRQLVNWILVATNGDLRGEVSLPRNARPLWSRGGSLWAELLDESDIPWLVRYRIAAADAAS